MPKDWSRRTRLKVAAVAALLGLLVWADAHWSGTTAGTTECPTTVTSATAAACAAR